MVPYEILIRGNVGANAIKGIHVIATPGAEPRVLEASDLPEILGDKSQLLSQISSLSKEMSRLKGEMDQIIPMAELTDNLDAGN